MNAHDKRTDAAKLKDVGISSAKWSAWLKRKSYHQYYRVHAERIFDEELQVEAQRAIGDLVRAKDLQAIKYLDERTGVYRSNNGNNNEVLSAVLQAMFSILARNVEPKIINIISAELRDEPVIKGLFVEVEEAS